MLGANVIALAALSPFVFGQVASLQIPLQPGADLESAPVGIDSADRRPRQLHGRFLQITGADKADFHPDRFYKVYSSTSKEGACHRGTGPAGYYGAETSECDSPLSLVNATFDWIKANLKDQIDFVIWTGDSARHDNDEEIPRSMDQVVGLNEYMVQKVVETWGKPDDDDDDPTNDLVVPVVPTFGNNDILPHNIFEKGPNSWTKTYMSVWKKFIPEEQRHQFDQGGWFSVEVIPNHLVVFSLNSLYFFDSNSAVDGCSAKSEPGFRQLEWLRIQLQYLRNRNMKAIIIGHVPPARTPNKQSWDESCWQKYALWMRQYRDVVTASMYGHMNLDHFMLQDFEDINKDVSKGYEMIRSKKRSVPMAVEQPIKTQVSGNYLVDLRDIWSELPQPPSKGGKKSAALQMIADASDEARPEWEIEALLGDYLDDVTTEETDKKKKGDKKKPKKPKKPDDYLDQIGGEFAERFAASLAAPSVVPNYFPTIRIYEYNITGLSAAHLHPQPWLSEEGMAEMLLQYSESDIDDNDDVEVEKKKKKKKKGKKQKFTVPEPPSDTAPPGPAYSPQSLSLLKFTQYYANLTRINNDFTAASELELEEQKWKEGKHKGKKPHDREKGPHPKKFEYEVLYDTQDDKIYNLTDLTMRSYLDLAQRIGKSKKNEKSDNLDIVPSGHDTAEDRVVDDEILNEQDSDTTTMGKKHKKKKDKKKKKKGKKADKTWLTFVRRAFVATMDEDEIEDNFG